MTDDEKPIDLEKVREGDAHLERARRLHDEEGREPRPVPLEEIAMEDQTTFSVQEAARLAGLSEETIRREIRAGKLKAAQVGTGPYRISRVEIANWWRSRGGGELFGDE